jgi:hypothetical protein
MADNLLLGNGRPVRRWTEHLLEYLFSVECIEYPHARVDVPNELEANRLVISAALRRNVDIREIWPELKPTGIFPIASPYFVCAPFSSDVYKDFPEDRWVEFFVLLHRKNRLPHLVLTGSTDQRDRLESFLEMIAKSLPGEEIPLSVVVAPDLQSCVDLLAAAECVFTVDTAAAHAAAALDRRALILLSGLHQGMFAPWRRSERQHWVLPGEMRAGIAWYAENFSSVLMAAFDKITAVS